MERTNFKSYLLNELCSEIREPFPDFDDPYLDFKGRWRTWAKIVGSDVYWILVRSAVLVLYTGLNDES